MEKVKVFFEKDNFILYSNIKMIKNSEILILPFYFEKNNSKQIIINLDYFSINAFNYPKIKNLMEDIKKKYEVMIIWKSSIKNLIFFLRLFPNYELKKIK